MKRVSKYDFSFSEIEESLNRRPFYSLLFNLVILSLFFIQALRAYVPGVYVAMFHVVFAENIVENLLILLTLIFYVVPALTNTICKKFGIKRVLISSMYIIAISRLLMAFHLPNIWQTILAGIVIAVYGMFISTFITLWVKDESTEIKMSNKIKMIIFSLLSAFLLDYLIRTIGFSQDISLLPPGLSAEFWYITQYLWLIIQVPLTVLCIYFTQLYFPRFTNVSDAEDYENSDRKSTVFSLIFIGIGMFLFLLFNLFLYPNIIAHYTKTSYYISNILSITALIVVILVILRVKMQNLANIKVSIILNSLLIIFLCLFLFMGALLTYVAIILASVSLIIIFVNLLVLFSSMATISFKWEKVKTISNSFAIGVSFYILFSVFHILSTDWAYVIAALKGFGPFVLILAGILLSASVLISIIINQRRRD
jgi:MFS family permease